MIYFLLTVVFSFFIKDLVSVAIVIQSPAKDDEKDDPQEDLVALDEPALSENTADDPQSKKKSPVCTCSDNHKVCQNIICSYTGILLMFRLLVENRSGI